MDRYENKVPELEERPYRGGPQGEDDESEAKRKAAEREQKKAEVRKRLEEAGKKGKKKKGFLTPERKKKLRKLLMMKAADNLKTQQKQLESERNNMLSKRLPPCPNVDTIDDKGQLEKIYNDLFSRMVKLEEEKYDINCLVSQKDSEINELTIAVNDLRGKFVKPTLKKVSKYDNKFKKLGAGEGTGKKEDFRAKLKTVKKENAIEAIESKTKKTEKPEWTKKPDTQPKAAAVRRSSAASTGASSTGRRASASSKTEEPPAQPVEAEVEEEEEIEEEEE